MFDSLLKLIVEIYGTGENIALHEPIFEGNEKAYLAEAIDSSFVSNIGPFVTRFEERIQDFTGSKYAIATNTGTSALHLGLLVAGVGPNDEVITQALSFVATSNAIRYCNAQPVYVDIDRKTLGMSPQSLENFLQSNTRIDDDGYCINIASKRRIRACLPVHSFGHPVQLDEIRKICDQYHLVLIEDAAEALGSLYKTRHTGTAGALGIFSFNGNKIATSGGGGSLITNDETLASRARHLATTARVKTSRFVEHDQTAYNYAMPNISAALGCAQMERLNQVLIVKRHIAGIYHEWCDKHAVEFVSEPHHSQSNYWLNTLILDSREQRDALMSYTNTRGIQTRAACRQRVGLPSAYSTCRAAASINNSSIACVAKNHETYLHHRGGGCESQW
jgi:aminotransferase in exopolysaccharide biosynthesis